MRHPRFWRRVCIAALLFASASWALGYLFSHPANRPVGMPPADLGAVAVSIPRNDGPPVAGWLARGVPGRGAVLLLHPLRATRVSMLTRARFLQRAGYTVLLIDLPAHGESEGERITFGARESEAARAALVYLRKTAEPGTRVGALGVSLGGASLLLGEGNPPANLADAIVIEAVYPTIDEAAANRLRIRLGSFGPPLAPLLTGLLWQIGLNSRDLRPIDRIGELRVPVLVIAGEADRHTTLDESRRIFAAAPEPKTLWTVPDAPHGDFYALAPEEYERRLLAFFRQHLRSAQDRGDSN